MFEEHLIMTLTLSQLQAPFPSISQFAMKRVIRHAGDLGGNCCWKFGQTNCDWKFIELCRSNFRIRDTIRKMKRTYTNFGNFDKPVDDGKGTGGRRVSLMGFCYWEGKRWDVLRSWTLNMFCAQSLIFYSLFKKS